MTTLVGIKTNKGIVLSSDLEDNSNLYSRKIHSIPGSYLIGACGLTDEYLTKFLGDIKEKCKKNSGYLRDILFWVAIGASFHDLLSIYGERDSSNYGGYKKHELLNEFIIATSDNNKDWLFHLNVVLTSGTYKKFDMEFKEIKKWVAVGSGSEHVKELIEEEYDVKMSLKDTILCPSAYISASAITYGSGAYPISFISTS